MSSQRFDLVVVGGGATGCGVALDAATRGLKVALVERDDFGAGTSARSTKLLWAGSRYLVQAFVRLLSPSSLMSPRQSLATFRSEFNMVLNCHKERRFLLEKQRHLTHWLPIAVPMDRWLIWPPPFAFPIAALGPLGLFAAFFKFYDALGQFCSPPSHLMSKARAFRKFPQLSDRVHYCCVFYEGQHNDSRTNLSLAMTAIDHGAVLSNHVEVVGLIRESDCSDEAGQLAGGADLEPQVGRVVGVRCVDRLSAMEAGSSSSQETEFTVRGDVVMFCGGPFTDDLREMDQSTSEEAEVGDGGAVQDVGAEHPITLQKGSWKRGRGFERAVLGASGTHVVLPPYFSPSGMGLVDMATSDGRFLFFLPWLGHTVVGTTDSPCPTPSMRPRPSEQEISWIVEEANKYLAVKIRRSDVLSAWSGVRPLASDPHQSDDPSSGVTAAVSRDHVISVNPRTGLVFVAGGKWTTYREMAQDAVDCAVKQLSSLDLDSNQSSNHHLAAGRRGGRGGGGRGSFGPCVTLDTPLVGAQGFDRLLVLRLQQAFPTLGPYRAQHLARTYGGEAHAVLQCAPHPRDDAGVRGGGGGGGGGRETSGEDKGFAPLVPGFPYLEEEVVWAARRERCERAADVLGQRTRLAFLNVEAAREALPRVVELLGAELRWSESRRDLEQADAEAFLSTFGGPEPHAAAQVHRVEEEDEAAAGLGRADGLTVQQSVEEIEAEEDRALEAAFQALDVNGSGVLDASELVSAMRLLQLDSPSSTKSSSPSSVPPATAGVVVEGGTRTNEVEDSEILAVLQLAFPDSGLAEEGQADSNGRGAKGQARGVTLAEFKAWWRSPGSGSWRLASAGTGGVHASEAELKRRLFDRYAATHGKLERQTGVAFG